MPKKIQWLSEESERRLRSAMWRTYEAAFGDIGPSERKNGLHKRSEVIEVVLDADYVRSMNSALFKDHPDIAEFWEKAYKDDAARRELHRIARETFKAAWYE